MAKLFSKSQVIRAGVQNPMADQSRIILVQLILDGGLGDEDYGVTPQLGNRVRLLSVDVWLMSMSKGGFIEGYLKVRTGTGEKLDANTVAMRWSSVMDVSMLFKVGMFIYCCDRHFRFDMNKLYTTQSQRFGLWSQSNSVTKYSVLGAFQIAEG